jgi:hypothetical protein
VVTPIPCPITVIFLFVQETVPPEHEPEEIFTVSPSADELTALCSEEVISPEQVTFLVVPVPPACVVALAEELWEEVFPAAS